MMGVETTTSKYRECEKNESFLLPRSNNRKSFLVVVILVLVSTVVVVVVVAQGMLSNYYQSTPNTLSSTTTHSTITTTMQSTTTKPSSSSLLFDSSEITNSNNIIIYGHLHFPKTGGTNLNGRMAATYDNVCGNKGYSYDAYQFNSRGRQNNITIPGYNIDAISEAVSKDDSKKYQYNKNGKGKFDRGKVPKELMKEIGYEDCHYISQEKKYEFWPELINDLNRKNNDYNNNNNNNNNSTLTLELHVPCREPLQHLMSMASHLHKKYVCDEKETEITIETAIDKVYLGEERFSNTFNHNIELKCFNPFPLENYIHYMKDKLTSRRFPVPYYQSRTTNKKHDKAKECIWDSTTSDDYKQKVIQLLIEKYPYMKFCFDCIGSSNELQLQL